jgi:hypothetical protein
MVNPIEFLHIYSTSILTAGGNEAVMANYFLVALMRMARSWLMNLPEGTLHSWSELCCQFTANFESAYARPGNETDLHAIQQCLGESLRSIVQWFSQVRNIISRISNASVVVVFRQGVRDEKMLEKLTTHDIQDVFVLFRLADKCARAGEGRAWHSLTAQVAKGECTPSTGAQAQGGNNGNNKKKKAGGNQPLAGVPTAAAAAAGGGHGSPRGDKHPRQPSNSDDGSMKCPVHNSTRNTARGVPGDQEARGIIPRKDAAAVPTWRAFPPAGGQAEGELLGGEKCRDGVSGCQEGTEGRLWPL